MGMNNLKFLVTASLDSKFAKGLESKIGKFPRDINGLSLLATTDKDLTFCEQLNYESKEKTPKRTRQKVSSDACWLGRSSVFKIVKLYSRSS